MCGIYGYIGKIPEEQKEIAFSLLYYLAIETEIRGKQATGYAALWLDERFSCFKQPVKASEFVNTKEFLTLYKNMPDIFIGHNRFATASTTQKNQNNHPFISGPWSLVHNGHIYGANSIAQRNNIHLQTGTDSEVLAHLMNGGDPLKAVTNLYQECTAPSKMAVAAINRENKKLYLFRNKEKPTWIFEIPSLNSIWFTSTLDIFYRAFLRLFGENPKYYPKEFWQTKSLKLYTIDIEGNIVGSEVDEQTKVKHTTHSKSLSTLNHLFGGDELDVWDWHGMPYSTEKRTTYHQNPVVLGREAHYYDDFDWENENGGKKPVGYGEKLAEGFQLIGQSETDEIDDSEITTIDSGFELTRFNEDTPEFDENKKAYVLGEIADLTESHLGRELTTAEFNQLEQWVLKIMEKKE